MVTRISVYAVVDMPCPISFIQIPCGYEVDCVWPWLTLHEASEDHDQQVPLMSALRPLQGLPSSTKDMAKINNACQAISIPG